MISPSIPMFLRNSRLSLQSIITELSMLIGSYSNRLSLLKISSANEYMTSVYWLEEVLLLVSSARLLNQYGQDGSVLPKHKKYH